MIVTSRYQNADLEAGVMAVTQAKANLILLLSACLIALNLGHSCDWNELS